MLNSGVREAHALFELHGRGAALGNSKFKIQN